MTSTPSPAGSGSGSVAITNASSSSGSRRQPRKSTLTQQQKNQKRQRATQEQLNILEHEFEKNPTPTALVRERIAEDINMTERSVQIWFQNKRAKMKVIAKKSIEEGGDCGAIPESMRRYLATQALETGKSFGGDYLGRSGSAAAYGAGPMLFNGGPTPSKVVIQYFSCRTLSIGKWRRKAESVMDLVIFYSPGKSCITYYINNDSTGYKIEYPFSHIKNITLDPGDVSNSAEGASQNLGGIWVELFRPPNFFMDSYGSGGFYQCGDFSEDQQASQVMVHHLGGHPKVLSEQLAKLLSLDTFQNRHSQGGPNFLAVSAPVSPHIHRPVSQPNHFVHPHPPAFAEDGFAMPMLPPRGHKRQRSRSVPVAMDFSYLRQPMPSFLIQHPEAPAPYMHNPHLIAPVPQHHSTFGPVGPNLSIDTSAGYGLDMKTYPLSATTATSPMASDFGTPAFLNSGAASDNISAANFNTPYSGPYLSPMLDPTNVVGPSVSPLHAMGSHTDPEIADQSPPLALHRSMSADYYSSPFDQNTIPEEVYPTGDIFSKHSYTLPFRTSPIMEENNVSLELGIMFNFGNYEASQGSPNGFT